jgi:GTPase SAR1 family protein
MGSSSGQSCNYDLSFKILLIGDSAVGKSSLLVSFISNSVEDLSPTIGTFFFFFFFFIIFPVFNDLKCKIFDKANVIFRFLSSKTESNTVGSMTRFLSLSNGKKNIIGSLVYDYLRLIKWHQVYIITSILWFLSLILINQCKY